MSVTPIATAHPSRPRKAGTKAAGGWRPLANLCLAAAISCLPSSPLAAILFDNEDFFDFPEQELGAPTRLEAEPPGFLASPALAGPGVFGTSTAPPPGVTLVSTGSPRASASVRGLIPGHTLLHNGPFRLPAWGAFFPGLPDPAESIFDGTVILHRQARSVLHGGGASGGSLTVGAGPAPATHPEDPIDLTLFTELRSRPRSHASGFQTVSGEGPYALQIRSLRRQSTSFSLPAQGNGQNDQLDDLVGSAGITYFLPRGGRISAHGAGADHQFFHPAIASGNHSSGERWNSRVRSTGAEADLPLRGERLDRLSLIVGHATHSLQPVADRLPSRPRADWTLTQIRGSTGGETHSGHRFQTGIEGLRERIEPSPLSGSANDVSSDSASLFWRQEGSATSFRWLLGGRLEGWDVSNAHGQSRTGTGGAFSADLFHDLDHGSTARAGLGYQDLAPSMDHLLFGPPQSASHRMVDGRMGWDREGDQGGFSILLYGRHLPRSPVTGTSTPLDGAPSGLTQMGGEVGADWTFCQTPDGLLRWEGWVDHTRALSRDERAYAEANRSLRIYNRIEGEYHLWSGGVDLLHWLKTGRAPDGPAQTLLGIDLRRTIYYPRSQWDLTLRWSNLIGESQQSSTLYSPATPPRRVTLAFSARF